MRRTLLITIAVQVATGSVAVAAPMKGKPLKSGPGCKPQVAVILNGTVATAPGSGATLPFSLQVKVMHANRIGHAYVQATQPVSVMVTDKTKIKLGKLKGLAALRALQGNDRLRVQALACKADLANGATPTLTAKRVDAHHPAS